MINDIPTLVALHEGKRMAFAQILDIMNNIMNNIYNDEEMPVTVDELYKYIRAKVFEETRILDKRVVTLKDGEDK